MEDGGAATGKTFDREVSGPPRCRHSFGIPVRDPILASEGHDSVGGVDAERFREAAFADCDDDGVADSRVQTWLVGVRLV